MKQSDKLSICAGVLILCAAAVILISLMLQFLGYNPAADFWWRLENFGAMLHSVYGYSCILIPLYLIIASVCLFSPVWNSRRGVYLSIFLLPFFTVVLVERLCNSIFVGSGISLAIIKASAVILVSALLIAIEYLIAGILYDMIEAPKRHKARMKAEEKRREEEARNKEENDVQPDSCKTDSEPLEKTESENVETENAETESEETATEEKPVSEPESAVIYAEPPADYLEPAMPSSQNTKTESPAEENPAVTEENAPEAEKNSEELDNIALSEVQEKLGGNIPPKQLEELVASNPLVKEELPEEDQVIQLVLGDDGQTQDEPIMLSLSDNDEGDSILSAATPLSDDDFSDDQSSEPLSEATAVTDTGFVDSSDFEEADAFAEADKLLGTDDALYSADEAAFLEDPFADGEKTDEADVAAPQTNTSEDADEAFVPAAQTATGPDTDKADDTPSADFAESEIRAVSQPVFGDYEAIKNQFFCTDSSPADQTDSASADTSVPGAQTEPAHQTVTSAAQTVTNEDTDEAVAPGAQTPTSAVQTEPAPETPASEDTAEPVSGVDTASYDFDDDTPQPPAFDTDDYEPNLYSGDTDDEDDDEDRFDDDEITEEDEIDIPVPQGYTQNPSAGFSQSYNAHPYSVPTEGLLNNFENNPYWIIDEETKQAAVILKETLSEFKIEAEVTGIRKGPVVTMFELLPAPGVKLNKIVALQDNIALRLAASSVRIVAPIPGKKAVGVEVPNSERAMVSFRELIEKDLTAFNKMQIPVVLGKDITGDAQMLDLATTPHLLIAGSTGSGKSVCVNSMILSILYKRSPRDVKMILIDPKIVELKLYNDIPHLLTPVITEPKKAFQALQYCLCEMERRYAMLDKMGVREIKSYNHRIAERHLMQEKLPYIVVIIDEFADLMATTGKELETTVARLAAMSRAVGIHLVLATQRPSIDVITGLIKANIPSRIAFMVASKTDSRIIIDQVGSEKLLGKGDMLYASAIDPFPVRIQGTFVTEDEVERVVNYVKQIAPPEYIDDEIFVEEDEDEDTSDGLFTEGEDPLYDKALNIVVQEGKASASYLQRRLKIGYNRAARLVEDMEARGIVGPANGSKPRELIHVP